MARYTPIYGDFLSRTREVKLLCSKAARLERARDSYRHGPEISALCRGAVVLLSSHVEAFVKELGEHTLDTLYNKSVCRSKMSSQFFYHISKSKLKSIRDTSQPDRIADHVFEFLDTESSYWSRNGGLSFPVSSIEFNAGFSNPKFGKVKAYFGRFGYTNYKGDFFSTLGRGAITNESNLNHIVDTRNSIAHGDPAATKTPLEVKGMINAAILFCRTTDDIFATWCRTNLCTIR